MKERGLELLAPAGNLETLKTVVSAGADAIYFGGDLFGARAYAKNFTLEEAEEGISYAHLFGRKCFLTVNTLLKNIEIEKQLYAYLKAYYEMGIDGILVQDFGVLSMLRDYFPEVAIHSSTQMSTSSVYGVKKLRELGVERVVLGREVSLRETKEIYNETGMELEAFLHGALCVCYSGNCYMSSLIGGRSGNRGRCAQPCRLPYMVEGDQKPAFWLSPKDMSGLHRIPDLYDAGVYSLKLEGRMKSREYADAVTSLYRKYVDRFLNSSDASFLVDKKDDQLLLDSGNRTGFTDLYMDFHNGPDLMAIHNSSHHSAQNQVEEKPLRKYELQAEVVCHEGEPLVLRIFDQDRMLSQVEGSIVESALNRPTTSDEIEKRIRKTGDTDFTFTKVDVSYEGNCFVIVSKLNELRRMALEETKSVLTNINRNRPKEFTEINGFKNERAFDFPLDISVRTPNQLQVIIEERNQLPRNLRLILPHMVAFNQEEWRNTLQQAKKCEDITLIFSLPPVIRLAYSEKLKQYLEQERFDIYEANSIDGLGLLEDAGIHKNQTIMGTRLYTWSNRSLEFFRKEGYESFVTPYELNEKEFSYRDNRDSIQLIYGYLPMMIMANCTRKNHQGCDHTPSILKLTDRKKAQMSIWNDCSICMNTIYNSVPFSLLTERTSVETLGYSRVRMDFTIEDEEDIKEVLREYNKFRRGDKFSSKTKVTYGHFHRGVE